MKKLIPILILICLLVGCGEAPQAEEEPRDVSEVSAPAPELPEEYLFVCSGIALSPGDSFDPSLFEETEAPMSTPDCRTNQIATVYSYDGFTVQTVSAENQLTGEVTEPYISAIELSGPSSYSIEGACVGMTEAEILALYGDAYEELYGGHVYTKNGVTLSVYFDDSGYAIYVVYALNPEKQAEMTEAAEKELDSFLENLEEGQESGEIRFEGLHTRHTGTAGEEFIPENYDFTSDVKAFDSFGNELPVSSELYIPETIVSYGLGPILYVFRTEDSAGNSGMALQTCFLEEYEEEASREIAEEYASQVEATDEGLVELKNIIRNSVYFSESYGGYNPVLVTHDGKRGNCYSHNRLLYEVLEYMGYEVQMIWDEAGAHYWCLVKTESGWRHLDATPLDNYPETLGLLTDEERAKVKPDRLWNTELWPDAN